MSFDVGGIIKNALPDQFTYGAVQSFHTADGHQYTFLLQQTGDKYRPRVVDQAAPPVTDLSALKLVDGPYLKAPNGHDGFLEITSPTSDAPLVLDYRVAAQPVRIDNADAWPQPLIDRAGRDRPGRASHCGVPENDHGLPERSAGSVGGRQPSRQRSC